MAPSADDREAELVAAVARGEEDAVETLYRRHLPLVVRWCLRETGNRELAADLSAEVFAAALTAARRFRPERGAVAAWLLGIARNKLADSRRRGRIEASARRRLRVAPWSLTDADLERVEDLASLDGEALALLEQLPAATREALRGRVVDERSYEDLAGELQCSQAVVRQHVSRGLRRLRSELEET
jgi:RNA polymerase sigma-70 factor (ECF subfamily)